jgi:hypothetical protein
MKGLQYIIFVWLIGVFVSPVLHYIFMGLGKGFFDIYLLIVIFGGIFSLITEIVLIGVFFLLIVPNFKTVFQVKLVTNIAMVILTFLTFFVVSSNTQLFDSGILILISPYIITMSVAIWTLKLNIQQKEDIPFINDDDVL